MRVALTPDHLDTPEGRELLDVALRMTRDGRLDLAEIKELYRWLRAHHVAEAIPPIGYLLDILRRITADKVIDRDELLELHLAVERVIPQSMRGDAEAARRVEEAARRERIREQERLERAAERQRQQDERQRARDIERRQHTRLRHHFAKVSGVTFPNDDGSERQEIIRDCRAGESLTLRHDPSNRYSPFAIQVLRQNGQQIGHVPEHLAEQLCREREAGHAIAGRLIEVTGGTGDKEPRGVNVAVFIAADDVAQDEFERYVRGVMSARSLPPRS
jgi:hypothetical protein